MLPNGAVGDRPWGALLAELARAQVTGDLVVMADGKCHAIGFEAGMITSAVSPAAADSIGRIALTSHLVTSTQVADIMRQIAAAPGRDEVELLAEVARLSTEQCDLLRRRLVVQRAARTFALEQGTYAFDARVSGAAPRQEAIDVRSVIYLGARMHLAETRLANELRALGSRFALRVDATGELAKFEFTNTEQPILDALRSGTSVAELEAMHRALDPRVIAAAVYALVTSGACSAIAGAQPAAEPAVARTMTPTTLVNARVSTKDLPAQPAVPRTMTPQPAVPRTMTPQPAVPRTMTPQPAVPRTMTPQPAVSRATTPPFVARTPTPSHEVGSSTSLRQASPPVAIPRTMTPPTAEVALPRTATDNPLLARTPTKDRTPEWLEARGAFQRAEMAMRRDQIGPAIADFARAVELQPDNADYIATLAWARFCAAIDKKAVAAETRKTIDAAIRKSEEEAITPWLCLGRVERMLGLDTEALRSFHKVLELQPHNTTAASEVRVLEARRRR